MGCRGVGFSMCMPQPISRPICFARKSVCVGQRQRRQLPTESLKSQLQSRREPRKSTRRGSGLVDAHLGCRTLRTQASFRDLLEKSFGSFWWFRVGSVVVAISVRTYICMLYTVWKGSCVIQKLVAIQETTGFRTTREEGSRAFRKPRSSGNSFFWKLRDSGNSAVRETT